MRKLFAVSLVLLIAVVLAVACAPAAPTAAPPAPTAAPVAPAAPTAAPAAPTSAPPPTAVPPTAAPTAVPPTAAPTAVPTPTIPPPLLTGGEGCAPSATKVTWFVGLGAGSQPDQVPIEKKWVDDYNKSQTDVCLILNVVFNTGQNSYDALRAMVAAGNAPEIVGPVGKAGRASFQGAYADLSTLAKNAGFDLTAYDPNLLEFTKDEGVLVGIPFALYPSVIYYNKALFDEAKLPYPPHKVGEQYQGKDWTIDTMQQLAMKLTVDKNGNDATQSGFDPKNIKQFGFVQEFTSDARSTGALFGGGLPYDPKDPTKAVIPDNWKAQFKWYYDAIWKNYFMPNTDYTNSDLLSKGNAFSSGNVAMAYTHSWYTCCFDMKKMNWDVAVVPSYNGKITAKLHGDTFAILKQSKNQAGAFKVLTKMIADKDLFQLYGALPAVVSMRPDYWKTMDTKVGSNKVDWAVFEEMLKYPDLPNHESWMPNFAKATDVLTKFRTNMESTPGLNMDDQINKLQTDLSAVFKETNGK